jgi:hypothetical protein
VRPAGRFRSTPQASGHGDERGSRGSRWRIPACCPGMLIPDLISILGSIFFVVGDVDK